MISSLKPSPEEMYRRRLASAPSSVQLLIENIKSHFSLRNDSFSHHTRTHGGDLRVAIPGHLLGRKVLRNFGTLSWRPGLKLVTGRAYLSPEQMMGHAIRYAAKPKKQGEPLLSDFWLQEGECLRATKSIIDALEDARLKMMRAYEAQS
ncbi:hypothetical protein [Roseobacter sp. AzwK-3b]|uniref:hypothetical protein n=1 Tax=Roseobacter sp. AzwK-3b TaxID=351016 RepID=UPI0012F4E900|nr:hypothetical protein [Roseobacter sp. AzwK-3b]